MALLMAKFMIMSRFLFTGMMAKRGVRVARVLAGPAACLAWNGIVGNSKENRKPTQNKEQQQE